MDAVILAGGENTRIPVPKGFLCVDGQPIIERNIRLLSELCDTIYVSTNDPEAYFSTGAILIGDVLPVKGPMTGIYSVLRLPEVRVVFVTACDMPFINVILMRYVMDQWTEGRDAVIPIFRNKPEPLFGVYAKTCVPVMEDCLSRGERGLQSFLERISVLYVSEAEVRRRDPDGKSFVNINTLEDYQKEIGGTLCLD